MDTAKVWFVTGASQGLGLHLVKKLLAGGYRVAAGSRRVQVLKDAVGFIDSTRLLSLVVGLGIGLLQALTQIQEQTLVFVPKIVAVFVVLLIFLPFAGSALGSLMTDIAARIAAY